MVKKAPARNRAGNPDFTYKDLNRAGIRFNSKAFIEIEYEADSEDVTITKTDEIGETVKTINSNFDNPGGGANLGTKTITENGTYNASADELDGYSSVTVNVPATGYTIEDIAAHNYSGDIVFNGTNFNALFSGSAITSFRGVNCTGVATSAFENCSLLTDIYIGGSNSATGNYSFRGCSALKALRMPFYKGSSNLGGYGLSGCTSLEMIDYGNVNTAQFNSLPACPLNTVILRKTGSITTLSSSSALDNSTAFQNGGTGGVVYVPSDLISTYEAATNWSTYVAYGTLEFKALEGSAYENPDF